MIDRFIEQCRTVATDSRALRELVAELVSEAPALAAALPEPAGAGFEVLYRAPDLTVLNFAWAPWMCFKPHNHCMASVVGIFSGREDNVFWRRVPGTRRVPGSIEAAGAQTLGPGDVTTLGRDIIHSVVNPIGRMTRAIHVYGGDFFAPPRPRSEWDHETLVERPWDIDHTRRMFAEAEARAHATSG